MELRKKCGRVAILNGTPIANTPMDMYAQGEVLTPTTIVGKTRILKPNILEVKSFFHFRARYAVMGGWQNRQIIEYQNLEDLQNRFKPHVLRREKRQCLDLPPVLPPVTFEVPLDKETWKIYKAMRDEMVAWLSSTNVSVAQQAIVKAMRLAQICSGFLGGIVEEVDEEEDRSEIAPADVQEVGREKLDFMLKQHKEWLIVDPNLKLLSWSRFIPELRRYLNEVSKTFPTHDIGCVAGKALLGSTKNKERDHAMRLLDPRTAPSGPNFTACHTTVSMSSDYSPWKKDQADARVDRPGQIYPVSNFDIIATGPGGQKTIDHHIVKTRRNKEDINKMTASAWVAILMQE
jgi:SNF2 family DNA or RNA helicase